MSPRPGIELANLTDIGCHRELNEDYYGYFEPENDADFHRQGRLVIVADGMGGYEGGQLASSIAVETVRGTYEKYSGDDPHEGLLIAFKAANAAIRDHVRAHPALEGMGTTCTAAVIRDRQLFYGHVGDSRIYLIRGFDIKQITEDHSLVRKMVRDGVIQPEEAATHPDRNVLTNALGIESGVLGDFSSTPVALERDDIILLCTDGLHGLVSNEELLGTVIGTPPREACQELVRMAKQRGGFDNITVQILRIVE